MTARILHVSDLHIGRSETSEPVSALRELVAALKPELVLATGDLAHRGRRGQLERAAELLHGLGAHLLAVPGNHDLPYTFPGRFTRTFANWELVFGTTEPVYRSEAFSVVGLCSVRPWRQQGGALEQAQLDRAASALRDAGDRALRVVATHHHLAAPPWRTRKRPLSRRNEVLLRLADAGAELIVGGHVHQASVADRREFEVDEGRVGALVLATAAGFGRPRPRRRGEAVGLNVYESDAQTLEVATYAWDGRDFQHVAARSFARG